MPSAPDDPQDGASSAYAQPALVQTEPGLWQRVTGLFDRSGDAVIVKRRASPPAPVRKVEAEPPRAAVPLSPPEPSPAPPPEPEHRFGDDFLINAWKERGSADYDTSTSGPIGAIDALANSPVGDWIYKTFLKPRRRR